VPPTKGKWAQGITPRNFVWVLKDRLAVCERPGGYGQKHGHLNSAVFYVLKGHGWGHGVGMSQWGANGFARRGTAYDRILAHYYRGTTIEQAAEQIRSDALREVSDTMRRAEADAHVRIEELTREAKRVRKEADEYARDIRQAVDSYGTQARREADGGIALACVNERMRPESDDWRRVRPQSIGGG
jgi:hypothetical protein